MAKRDYYEVLGISKSADSTAIKKAYRQLAKKYHPDRNKEKGAEDSFKEVQEAYDILSDKQKRSAYDQYGFAGTQGFNGFNSAGSDFSGFDFGGLGDIFSQFFGADGGFGGATPNRNRRSRGSDIEVKIKIEFQTAVFGGEFRIKYKRKVACTHCKGTGAEGGKVNTCDNCEGRGQVTQFQQTFFGRIQSVVTCPKCQGEGTIAKEKCKKCNGSSYQEIQEDFTIKIPAGIPDNVNLRFSQRGDAGAKGGEIGDLYIHVEIVQHKNLVRRGDDVYLEWPVSAVSAALGDEVMVPTVHGESKLKIPAGVQPDHVLKMTGEAGPKFKTPNQNGDQYVQIKIQIPTKLSRSQKELWENLKKIS